jgi:hypothetical protein
MPVQSIDQTPEALNLTLRQYQEWNIAFEYTDSSGNVIDLTGYTPELQFRTSALAKTTVLSLTVGSGITFVPNANPQVTISADIEVAPGKYEWDLRLTAVGQGSLFLGRGEVIIQAGVTR